MTKSDTRLSRRMAYALRHRPEQFDLALAPGGWVRVRDLAVALGVTATDVLSVATQGRTAPFAKRRFSVEGDRVRADHGHSVPVELGHQVQTPPDQLWHGTHTGVIAQIREQGLTRQQRQSVHLSPDPTSAASVGVRRGPLVVIAVDAAAMHRDGFEFTRSGSGVWLVERVPAQYLTVLEMP